ncbi:winged helix-turn-helix domain-containing protein [Antarcticirhabdus aurantiaca]|uniref:winged helix-turn-helix domain-containing protein n=1 Tax=Antarcticirhabdus aurantiaca TaxID=2606717 RepID=UPI0034E2EDCF
MELPGGVALGPGKAALLEAIGEAGSIAAAGRRLRMSYKRAWGLVEALNADFPTPLVESSRGGAAQGGAHLTERGEAVLARYRAMEAKAVAAIAADLAALADLARRDVSHGT